MTTRLDTAPRLYRASIARGLKKGEDGPIDRNGGDQGAGLIRQAAIVTRGEALGHGAWLDATFVQQTVDAINAAGDKGVKARFTHPSLSGDGLGSFLGRIKNGTVDGDAAGGGPVGRADIHFSRVAHETPDGDLAAYVMDLAEQDPESFGMSIVFEHDRAAEQEFSAEHTNDDGDFESPDADNSHNFDHVRLRKLWGADAVDEPAANPTGLFHKSHVAHEADQLAAYALGLSQERPRTTALSVDPDRARGFIDRFLSQHGLAVVTAENPSMPKSSDRNAQLAERTTAADENATETAPPAGHTSSQAADPAKAREGFTAELKRYVERFGAENGTKWFSEGKSWTEALELQCTQLATERDAARQQAKETEGRLESLDRGEATPVQAAHAEAPSPDAKRLSSLERSLGSTGLARFAAGLKIPTPSRN